jgi:DNA-binding transcriptional ArsR family regulator
MDQEHFLVPPVVTVSFETAPVYNVLESMRELHEPERLSGFGAWVTETGRTLPAEIVERNLLVFDALYPILWGDLVRRDFDDFEDFINALAAQDPVKLRDKALKSLEEKPHYHPDWWGDAPKMTVEQMLVDRETFTKMLIKYTECDDGHTGIIPQAVDLYYDPPAMMTTIVNHLQMMWQTYVKPEWERVLPMLQESVNAYRQMEYRDLTALEAIRAVTGRDMSTKIEESIYEFEQMIFVPSAHIGPYIARFHDGKNMYVIFGARLPRGAMAQSSALSRSELLVRLNALSDDIRLRILELLTKHDEMCAQDIIEELGLSQSSVSRHLSQLSATGYITERRKEVSKCYSLNTDRVVDTVRALTNFLARG